MLETLIQYVHELDNGRNCAGVGVRGHAGVGFEDVALTEQLLLYTEALLYAVVYLIRFALMHRPFMQI